MTAINRDVADSGLVLPPAAGTPSSSSTGTNSSSLPSSSPSSSPSSVPSRPFQSRRDGPARRWGDCHVKDQNGVYEQDEHQEEERRGPWAAGTTLASPRERRPQSLSPQRTGPLDGIDDDGTVDSSPSVVTLVPLQDTQEQQQQQQELLQGQAPQVPQGKAPPLPQPQPQLVQQPFFVLDWWLEDLMLEQRQPVDAEHLATLLRTPTFNRRAPHPSQRAAANGKGSEEEEDNDDCSGGRVRRGSNQRKKNEPVAGSPLLRLLPWMRPQHEKEEEDCSDETTQSNRPRQGGGRPWGWFPGTPQPRSHKNHANTRDDNGTMESPTSCLSMPGTPKSSNRRRTLHPSKLGRKSRENEGGTGSNNISNSNTSHLPAPLCLQDKMDRVATTKGGCGGRAAQEEEDLRRQQEEEAALTERFRRKQQRQQERRKTQCIVQRSLTLAQAWTTKGLHKAHQEQWQDALNCWDNAYEIYSSLLGTNHLEVANVQNNRGIVLGRMGRVDEALEALEQAYEIRATHYQRCSGGGGGGCDRNGMEDDIGENATATTTGATTSFTNNTAHDAIPVLIGTLHNIANVHQQAGDLATALSVFGRAKQEVMNLLIDMDRHHGLGGGGGGQQQCPVRQQYQIEQLHHQSARLCTAMGHVYYDAQQWRDARDAYQDALEVYEHLVYDVWEKQQSAQQQAQAHSQSNNKSTKRNGYDKENRNTPNDEDQHHRLTANDKALKAVVIQELVHLKKDIYELDKRCKRQQSDMIVTIQQQLLDETAATTTRSSAPSRPVSCMAPSYGTNWDDCNYPWEDEDNDDGEQYHPPHEHPSLDDLVVHGRRNPPRQKEATFLMIPSLSTTPFPRG